jgi:RimJ/RimL family protein N-acetyltransferase
VHQLADAPEVRPTGVRRCGCPHRRWDNGAVRELQTERLLLRRWRPEDRAPFAALNADPEVMLHFPEPLTRRQSDRLADRIELAMDRQGWGLWALEERATGRFIGFTGLARPGFQAPFMPAVEIGWRLARSSWGRGYATEAARAALAHAFGPLALDEVVAMVVPGNVRSQGVMRKLGLRYDEDADFDHPLIEEGSPVRRHRLYRLTRQEWAAQQAKP